MMMRMMQHDATTSSTTPPPPPITTSTTSRVVVVLGSSSSSSHATTSASSAGTTSDSVSVTTPVAIHSTTTTTSVVDIVVAAADQQESMQCSSSNNNTHPPKAAVTTTTTTASFQGMIVRRRVMGRSLAFVDICVQQQQQLPDHTTTADNNDERDDDCVAIAESATACHPAASSATNNNSTTSTATSATSIVSVVFRREIVKSTNEFPTKKSSLPYGAIISVTCCCRQQPSLEAAEVAAPSSVDDSGQQESATTTTATATPLRWDVLEWTLLTNPHEHAMDIATTRTSTAHCTAVNDTTTNNNNNASLLPPNRSTTATAVQQQQQQQQQQQRGGISCTDYLRTRGQYYQEATKYHHQPKPGNSTSSKGATSTTNNVNRDTHYISPHCSVGSGTDDDDSIDDNNIQNASQPSVPQSVNNNIAHGNARAKALRAKIMAQWLVQNILEMDETDRVLDVAGGKGQLSMILALQYNIHHCTVMDIVQRRGKDKYMKQLLRRQQKDETSESIQVPTFISHPFTDDCNCDYVQQLVQRHTCLVGIHPDECTEAILNMALRHNKSVAIIPCCVFPSLFPLRTIQVPNNNATIDRPSTTKPASTTATSSTTTKLVQTYEDFIQYLLQKDPRLRITTLPFEGKNICIYLKVKNTTTPLL